MYVFLSFAHLKHKSCNFYDTSSKSEQISVSASSCLNWYWQRKNPIGASLFKISVFTVFYSQIKAAFVKRDFTFPKLLNCSVTLGQLKF